MTLANYNDKTLIANILTRSFENNQSVNYIVKQDRKRMKRIRALMAYAFDVCYLHGKVFLSEDKKACALILIPDRKKATLRSMLLDMKLVFSCTGIGNVKKAIDREAKIKRLHPKEPMYYLWFIGVDPLHQKTGIGTALLNDIIEDAHQDSRTIFLETSTSINLPWYEKNGFSRYNELDLGYKLFFLKR